MNSVSAETQGPTAAQATDRPRVNGQASADTSLLNECGEVLHRGTIQSIRASFLNHDHDYKRILDWQRKIVDLMNEHFIGRANGAGFYVVSLRTENGYPACSVFTPNNSGGLDVAIRNMEITMASDVVGKVSK